MPAVLVAQGAVRMTPGASTITIPSVSAQKGATILVGLAYDAIASVIGLDWGGLGMTLRSAAIAAGFQHDLWELVNVPSTAVSNVLISFDNVFNAGVAWAAEVRGLLLVPFDEVKNATGTGTDPDSGLGATTAQARELWLGSVMANGPDSDADGTWQNAFIASQRIGTTLGGANPEVRIACGYKVVSAIGTPQAKLVGGTSRTWQARVVAYKAATDVAASLSAASAASAAPQVGAGSSQLFPSPKIDPAYSPTAPVGVAPFQTGSPSLGLRSFGKPYFATRMAFVTAGNVIYGSASSDLFAGFSSGSAGTEASVLAALHGVPIAYASASEPHYLLSLHETGNQVGGTRNEILGLGVTPDLSLCLKTATRPLLLSGPGVMPVDGRFRKIRARLATTGERFIYLDDLPVAYDKLDSAVYPRVDDLRSPTGLFLHCMLFNGGASATRVDCSILSAEFRAPNSDGTSTRWSWPFAEGHGLLVYGALLDPSSPVLGQPAVFASVAGLDQFGLALDLRLFVGWYDPAPAGPQIWGAVPAGLATDSGPSAAFAWLGGGAAGPRAAVPGYRRVSVVSPSYARRGASATGFVPGPVPAGQYRPAQPGQTGYQPVGVEPTPYRRR